jgi:hypothetical protein
VSGSAKAGSIGPNKGVNLSSSKVSQGSVTNQMHVRR